MKDIIYFVKQIHSYAGSRLYINILAMTFIGLLESVGILLLIPMINMTGLVDFGLENSSYFQFLRFIEDIPASIALPIILSIYLLVVVGYNYIDRKIVIRNSIIQNGFLRKLRSDTYTAVLHSKWEFFIKNRKSDLINLVLTEVAKASGGTSSFLSFIGSLIFTFIQILLAFWLSPQITFFILLSGAFLVFANRKFLKFSLALGNRNYELGRSFLAGMTDQLNGIKDIKSNNLEESRLNWFHNITQQMVNEQLEYVKVRTRSQFYYKCSSAFLIVIFIFVALNMFQAQAGQLMLILVIFSRLWPRVAGIQSSLEDIATTLPAFKNVKSIQEDCKKQEEFQNEAYKNIEPIQLNRAIECRDVHFRYNKDESRYALQAINITIPAKQMTAFVGRSGAGKSTLIDLLMGLNEPESGQVLIDGVPLSKENILSLRSSLSYVPQDPFLFNTSIRENLMLVKTDASDEEMWEALTFASAAEFVGKLPNGLDSIIGDRGIKLSGGERQRLVLARAILRKPSILVLDEATSALDTESETKIQQALDRLKGSMTILVIAHRLSTIRNADQVIVLEDGQVIQQGGFYQLSQEKNKMFSKLLGKQLEIIQ